MTLKVFVCGEGVVEIGKWAESIEYRATSKRSDGVLFALYGKADAMVVDGIAWKNIKKFRSGGHASADQRALRAALLSAIESGAEVFLWVRDSDGIDSKTKELNETNDQLKLENQNFKIIETEGQAARRFKV